MGEQVAPKVFISYSWDSDEHKANVLNLANSLCSDGVQCVIDRYHEIPPPLKGWYTWMKEQIQEANFVLVVCTEKYLARYDRKEESGKGLGATWEGGIITAELYESQGRNNKFIPLILASTVEQITQKTVPIELRSTNIYKFSTNNYNLEDSIYEKLLRHLWNEPETPTLILGPRPIFKKYNPEQTSIAPLSTPPKISIDSLSQPEPLVSPKQKPDALESTYAQLESLLKAGKWKEADEDTARRMCEVMGQQPFSCLEIEDIEQFPCTHLRMIDQLWVEYSKGQYGFSVQKEIWQQCGSPTDRNNYNEQWIEFGEYVDWRSKGMMGTGSLWKPYPKSLDAEVPKGHLPRKCVYGSHGFLVVGHLSSLLQRLIECGM